MSTDQGTDVGTGVGEFMLFGVRVVVDSMRKSVSLNNLSQYEHRLDASSSNNNSDKDIAAGYASADEAVPNLSSVTIAGAGSTGGRERKRGIPWTEEEHKLFLIGLQKVGKGDWRGIARNFVKSRTPTQVASHAQKYFLRRSKLNRRRRRSSLFDITTDSVAVETSSDQQIVKDNNGSTSQSPAPPSPKPIEAKPEMSDYRFSVLETSIYSTTPIYPMPINNPAVGNEMKLAQPAPFLPATFSTGSKSMAEFDLNDNSSNEPSPLSLDLSLSIPSSDLANSPSPSSTRHPEFQVTQRLINGDSMISVA